MHILLGLAMGVALLYFWLIGHWFARILTFLAFVVVLFFVFTETSRGTAEPPPEIAVWMFAMIIAWLIASLPTYYWRHRMRRLHRLIRAV